MAKILVVDDEQAICWALSQLLGAEGFEVSIAPSAELGLESAAKERPELVVLDVRLPGLSGLDALPKFKEALPDAPVLVITAHGTMETAIEAMRRGAFNYLTKPLHNGDVLQQIRNALKTASLAREVSHLRTEAGQAGALDAIVGKSQIMQEVYKKIGAVAGSDASVLIMGESGTGKELAARAIHRYSSRSGGPFIAVNCASMPEPLLESELYGHVKGAFTGAHRDKPGKAETADGGTLFLDEIGEMPLSIQAKLLRFIEQKRFERVGSTESVEVNVRILAATNRDLAQRIARGQFREDLFFRLNVVSLEMPPLRVRREDIPLLVARFLERASSGAIGGARAPEITQEAMRLLMRCEWPGNVRELRNAVEHSVLLARGASIQPEHLPQHIVSMSSGAANALEDRLDAILSKATADAMDRTKSDKGNVYYEVISEVEKAVVKTALDRLGGNQLRASRLLGISRNTLRKLLEDIREHRRS